MPRAPRLAAIPLLALTALLLVGCPRSDRESGTSGANLTAADSAVAIDVVRRFGERLQRVSILAPDSIARESIRREYGDLVSRPLLEEWLRNPSQAPGRQTSSPWPERIEVAQASRGPSDEGPPHLVVYGSIVERSSATPEGEASGRTPVRMVVARQHDGVRLTQFLQAWSGDVPLPGGESPESAGGEAPDTTLEQAAGVIRSYYEAIAERRYRDAYLSWVADGAASGQSFEEFVSGFASTDSVEADVGPPGRVEGAAGSRYVKVPVRVYAKLRDGTRESYVGTYTVRRSVVDGATSSQRSWRIYSADLQRRSARPTTE